jgi:hypothetical protein
MWLSALSTHLFNINVLFDKGLGAEITFDQIYEEVKKGGSSLFSVE